MKIICDSCGAKYTVSDEKVQGKTVKVKCRKCSAVIVVSSTGDVTTTGGAGAGQGEASVAGAGYVVAVTDADQRNMTLDEVVSAYNEGVIDADTFVWAEGMDDWLPLRDVDAIVDALHEAAGQPEVAGDPEEELGATVAMTDGVPAELAAGGAMAAAAPAEQSPFDAAMAAGGASAGGGMFGAASGGGGYGGSESLNQIPAGDAKAGFSSGPGEENSAIFSLNMLTAKVGEGEGGREVPAVGNFADDEDSGLIDLKALAAGVSGDSALAGPLDVAAGDGVFPLGAPPPMTAPAPVTVDAAEPSKGSNKMMLAILASAVVALGAVLVFILVKGDGPPEPAASTSTPTVVTVVKTVVASAPAPTGEPTASASASATATSKVAARGPRPAGQAPAKSTSGGTAPAKPKTGPSKPARGKCGCDPNDLMCNMRCAQK